MINAFSANPAIATKYEAVIAKAMHKHKGPRAGMKPYTGEPTRKANPKKSEERYSNLIKHIPEGWNTSIEIGRAWGMTRESALNILYRMSVRNMMEKRRLGRRVEWRVKA